MSPPDPPSRGAPTKRPGDTAAPATPSAAPPRSAPTQRPSQTAGSTPSAAAPPRSMPTKRPGDTAAPVRTSQAAPAPATVSAAPQRTSLSDALHARATGVKRTRDDSETAQLEVARDRAWHLLNQLHTLMKAVVLHDARHPVAQRSALALCDAVAAMPPPFVIQFVAGGVFVDRTLVPLDFNHYERCVELTRALSKLSAHELSFETALSEPSALRLGQALAAGLRGLGDDLRGVEIPGVGWRDIPHAQSGIDAEGVDPDVAAITHTVLGLSVAEQIAEQIATQPDAPWQWNMGFAVIRRLEKGLAAKEGAATRVIEFAPEGWPVPRRALSASQLVLQVLTHVGVDPSNRRAAAHAALALGLQGLQPRAGAEATAAADALAARMLKAPIQAQSGVAPQCLLVASLVHMMGSRMRAQETATPLIVTDLIELAYEMERARCPERAPFDLTRGDLLAFAVEQGDDRFAPEWIRAVIKICGAVPVGACVQMADGRVGIVIEPGPPEHPWHPVVFVAGQRVVAQQPVMLVPPHKLRRYRAETRVGGATRVGY